MIKSNLNEDLHLKYMPEYFNVHSNVSLRILHLDALCNEKLPCVCGKMVLLCVEQ